MLLLVVSLIPAQAETFAFPDLNFRCTTPEGWDSGHKIGYNVRAVNPAKTKCFFLRVFKYDLTTEQIAQYENRMEAGVTSHGFTAARGAPQILAGVSFDTLIFTEKGATQTFRRDIYVGLVHGFIYRMEVSINDGNPSTDPELKAIVDSFGFIDTPAAPRTNRTSPTDTVTQPARNVMD